MSASSDLTIARRPWWATAPQEVSAALEVNPDRGLDAAEVASRRARYGENKIAAEPTPTRWALALRELGDPMNLMLVVVAVASFIIGQRPVGVMVAALVVLNVALGAQQALKALAAVDALAKMQTPQARVVRDGGLVEVSAPELVPGDIVQLEAGDLVPADGRILLSAVAPSKSPLQRELASLTKVLGIVAWVAVAIIVIIGFVRGERLETVLLLGISMAVSAIPTGMPTFVQAMLAFGAKKLAEARAVVKNLGDVETLGATSAINSDKTGTLTLNEMMVRKLYYRGEWFSVSGDGYEKTGRITGAAGMPVPDFTRLAYGLCLDSDATVSDHGEVVGDPTEAALVVLAASAWTPRRPAGPTRGSPRFPSTPTTSSWSPITTCPWRAVAAAPGSSG